MSVAYVPETGAQFLQVSWQHRIEFSKKVLENIGATVHGHGVIYFSVQILRASVPSLFFASLSLSLSLTLLALPGALLRD